LNCLEIKGGNGNEQNDENELERKRGLGRPIGQHAKLQLTTSLKL